MLEHWIWLAERTNMNEHMKIGLLQHFGCPEQIFEATEAQLLEIEGLRSEGRDSLLERSLEQASRIVGVCEKENIQILTYADAGYPERLKNIYDPPLVLYYKGTLPAFDDVPVIGVVGTRKASVYGLHTARRLGTEISLGGGLVVSGMADGIDCAAMNGAISAGCSTVGVLGCGVDIIYPKKNKSLFADTERCGCILSEFAPGTEPFRWNFPKRNRIISGLSCGVLVVEAPEKSGSLLTARLAAEQGRDVFAVPGNIDLAGFTGSNALLREGAGAVSCGWDILSEYQSLFPKTIRRVQEKTEQERIISAQPGKKDTVKVAQKPAVPQVRTKKNESAPEKKIDKKTDAPYSDLSERLKKLSADEQTVAAAIGDGERLIDDVIAQTALPTGKVLSILTMLELKKIVLRLPGKRICLRGEKQ